MLDIINLFIFLWLFFWVQRAFMRLSMGEYQSIYFVICIHFLFCGIPAFCDLVIGLPEYAYLPGFSLSSIDLTTNIIYFLHVCFCPVIWWKLRLKEEIAITNRCQSNNQIKCVVFTFLVLLPLLFLWIAPDKTIYFRNLTFLSNKYVLPEQIIQFQSIIALSTIISIIGFNGIILFSRKYPIKTSIFLSPFLLVNFILNGKRHIVALFCFLLLSSLLIKNYIKGYKLFLLCLINLIAVAIYSFLFQSLYRNISVNTVGFNQYYENIRVDYGRDDVIKMAIYSELYPDRMKILEFRGQSIFFNFIFFLPRSIFPNKPWPYATYFTSALLGIWPVQHLGWGMTTSWLDESIANFSWFGILIGPLFISLLCRLGDSQGSILLIIMTTFIACLLLAVHIAAFIIIFWVFILLIIYKYLIYFLRAKYVLKR